MKNNIRKCLNDINPPTIWELAKRTGLAYNSLRTLVISPVIPSGTRIDSLVKIADALGVSVDTLIGRKG